jgi:hypothetical protein
MKTRILLITLALWTVKTGMAQTNYASAIANNSGVFVSAYHQNQQTTYSSYNPSQVWYDIVNWQDGSGGGENEFDDVDGLPYDPRHETTQWVTNHWPQVLPSGTNVDNVANVNISTNVLLPPVWPQEHCDTNGYQAVKKR